MLVDKTDRQTEREGGRREDGKYYTCMKMVAFVILKAAGLCTLLQKDRGGEGREG